MEVKWNRAPDDLHPGQPGLCSIAPLLDRIKARLDGGGRGMGGDCAALHRPSYTVHMGCPIDVVMGDAFSRTRRTRVYSVRSRLCLM